MKTLIVIVVIATYILAINLVAFSAFYMDKTFAQKNERRISEANLLLIAGLGGTVGAITAQHKFRHKTRKQPFKSQLYSIAVLQVIALIALAFFPDLREPLLAFLATLLN